MQLPAVQDVVKRIDTAIADVLGTIPDSHLNGHPTERLPNSASFVFKYIEGDDTIWERIPIENIARDGELNAFKHDGFWHAMDTMRDRNYLEALWRDGQAPWKIWT